MSSVIPPRYVQLVWLHDHWGVSFYSDDREAVEQAHERAQSKVPCSLVVDTMESEGIGFDA